MILSALKTLAILLASVTGFSVFAALSILIFAPSTACSLFSQQGLTCHGLVVSTPGVIDVGVVGSAPLAVLALIFLAIGHYSKRSLK